MINYPSFFSISNSLSMAFPASFFFFEQGHEFAPDDASGGVCRCRFVSGFVGDAEPDHPWIPQLHLLDTLEVSLLLCIEFLLCSRHGRRRYHIDESVGMRVDLPDAFFAGFRRDEHNHVDAVLLCNGTIAF